MVTLIDYGVQNDLLDACERGDAVALRKYVAKHRTEEDYAVVDPRGNGPLHYAVRSESFECVDILLSTKLVDIHSLTHGRYESCLDYALYTPDSDVSWDIVRLLLENDPDFKLVKEMQSCPMEEATALLDLLEEMKFPFLREYHLFAQITANLHFGPDQAETAMGIFKRIAALVIDESSTGFMQSVFDAVVQNHHPNNSPLFKSCIEKWYLDERNAHRELVRQSIELIEIPGLGFYYQYIIMGLHSDIKQFSVRKSYSYYTDHLIKSIMVCLLQIDQVDCDVVNAMIEIISPKVDMEFFGSYFGRLLFGSSKPETVEKLMSTEWLDIVQIGDKLQFNDVLVGVDEANCVRRLKIVLNALMPFSTEVTADVYFPRIREKLNLIKTRVEQQDPQLPGYLRVVHTRAIEQLRQLDDNEEFSKYCVEGGYRAKSTLKSLCRAVIRRALLSGKNKSHSELVRNIQSLELPKYFQKYSQSRCLPASTQRFLLYNYSDYDFQVKG